MVAILSLLYLIPALIAVPPGSARLTPGVEVPSLREIHLAHFAANKDLPLSAPSPSPASASNPDTILASRQYNPRKRHPKRRFRGRALASVAPVPSTVFGNFGGEGSGTLRLNKFYEGSGFTENDDNPTTAGRSVTEMMYASTLTNNQALQSCADYSAQQDRYAFQLYFLGSQDIWVCRGYYNAGSLSDSSYFNVANDDVLVAYGYQTATGSG